MWGLLVIIAIFNDSLPNLVFDHFDYMSKAVQEQLIILSKSFFKKATKIRNHSLVDLRGGGGRQGHAPLGPNFFIFMQFPGNF